MKFTKDQKKSAYKKLSDLEKDFIGSNENIETIYELGKQYQLNEAMTDLLDTEVYNTMTDLQTIDQMTSALEKELGLSSSRILELVADLNNKIFKKLDVLRSSNTSTNTPSLANSQPKNSQQKSPLPIPIRTALSPRPDFSRTEIKQGGNGLIEDAEGNKDNNQFSSTNFQKSSEEPEANSNLQPTTYNRQPEAEYKMTEGEPEILKEKFVPPNLPTGKETPFEKKVAEQAGSGGVVKHTYNSGQDPYREPIN